jgi:Flp pilus assembly pilin Flp
MWTQRISQVGEHATRARRSRGRPWTLLSAAGRRRVLHRRLVRAIGTEAGQSMVEYAIVVALIAIAAMVAVQLLGVGIAQVFQNILARVQGLAG